MRALITGITGQDGAYLAEFLLQKGYQVFGLSPRRSTDSLWRLRELEVLDKISLIEGDVTDYASVSSAVQEARPTEVYNLAAQSFVGASFKQPINTMAVNATGALNVLDATYRHAPEARFYQASTSEMFGLPFEFIPSRAMDENSSFHPRSPYGVAKLAAHWATVNYREAYGMHASCGILFNHESPLRGEEFVTRKITKALAAIATGRQDELVLGNLKAQRDWGHARDFVRGMWLMLQQDKPNDYVLATGITHSVEQFLTKALAMTGLDWGCVQYDEKFERPSEVPYLCGDAAKARNALGWQPEITFNGLVEEMVGAEFERLGVSWRTSDAA